MNSMLFNINIKLPFLTLILQISQERIRNSVKSEFYVYLEKIPAIVRYFETNSKYLIQVFLYRIYVNLDAKTTSLKKSNLSNRLFSPISGSFEIGCMNAIERPSGIPIARSL